jgi:hypothetical protein
MLIISDPLRFPSLGPIQSLKQARLSLRVPMRGLPLASVSGREPQPNSRSLQVQTLSSAKSAESNLNQAGRLAGTLRESTPERAKPTGRRSKGVRSEPLNVAFLLLRRNATAKSTGHRRLLTGSRFASLSVRSVNKSLKSSWLFKT